MTQICWELVGFASQLLGTAEREVVRGDLEESGESAWQALQQVVGLVLRREAALWMNWRPWIAGFGLALPGSFLLMGASVSVSRGLLGSVAIAPLAAQALLLIGWAWSGGYVAGAMSRRTVWASAMLCCLPCLFCLSRFHIDSMPPASLFVFLLPAIWGAWRGLRMTRISRSAAITLAATLMALTAFRGEWMVSYALSWPAWYLAATARKETAL